MIVKLLDTAGLYTLRSFLDYIAASEWEVHLPLKPGIVTLLRGLPEPSEPALTFSFKITYKNKKGTTAEKTLQVDEKHMNVEFIYSSIQTTFATKCAHLGVTIDGDEPTDGTLQQCLQQDPGRQVGFSPFKNIDTAIQLVCAGAKLEKDLDFSMEPHTVDEFGAEVDHAYKRIVEMLEPVVSLTGACEATKRIFIDPILVAAARIVKDVTMEVERKIESPDANGPVDYIFKYYDRTICVTEGKHGNQDSGVSQNLAKLTAVREINRKRTHDDISEDEVPLYRIATTYLEWQFIQ
mmetsp:Transcript_436/g.679  ORF Transcript_436/g.679 Transcript_436/m.679 type:complete len:294 (-) Transcript_436:443-1324(-)|eukprot:CAMPEP_0119028676 /NCGR_PEP_ID=MMETSP1176-20130426/39318_1 /TAXON_ID=265551 /ORGANISM="Synedropsis recta cf, Strain CCMP1620" /LENGTH=293 /DNA_ID=CAMNT_0006984869 /DNA_START=117 /DNA_END=998 /DNA_ORIENTATION=-